LIRDCELSDGDVEDLMDLLAKTNFVTHLTFETCILSDSCVSGIARSMGRGNSVFYFRMKDTLGCSWTKEIFEIFHRAAETNLMLKSLAITPGNLNVTEALKQNEQMHACLEGQDTKLNISKRGLTWGLPPTVFSLANLTRLDASGNRMTSLSKDIKKLSSLTELNLRNNELADLPAELIYLRRLRVLDCQDNVLKKVPLCLGWMNEVEVINLRENLIATEPPELIGVLERLRDLDLSHQKLDGGGWTLPKKGGAARGEALVSWCRERNAGVMPARVRIVVLGEPNSGKTSLVRALQNGSSSKIDSEQTLFGSFAAEAEGISLSNMSLQSKNLEFKFWDFRSSLSWAANQSFFTNGAIYLICFDLRESIDHSNLGFWLSLVVSRAPDARIYLVGTHLDDPMCDKARLDGFFTMLQNNFMDRISNVRELFMVSSTTGKNVKDLLSAMVRGSVAVRERQANTGMDNGGFSKSKLLRNISTKFRKMSIVVPKLLGSGSSGNEESRKSSSASSLDMSDSSIGQLGPDVEGVPVSFIVFEQKLFALGLTINPPVINWGQFEGLALHSGIEKKDLRNVAEYLQDLGSIIYFSGDSVAGGQEPRSNNATMASTSRMNAARAKLKSTDDKAEPNVDDLVILDMRWLMQVFTSVTCWESSVVGQIELSKLVAEWDTRAKVFPPNLRKALFWLLEKFQVMFQTQEGMVFAPSLLERTRPANLEDWWPQRLPQKYRPICRVYNFEFLPLGFGGAFLASVQRMGWRSLCGWKSGMVLLKDQELLLVEVNPAQHSLRINIRYPTSRNCSTTLGPLAESLSTLIQESLRCSVRVDVPCLHCLAAGTYDYYVFDLDDLSARMAEGDYFAYCRSIHPVRIYTMAPDISVEGLDSHIIPYDSFELGEKLGEGSYSVVYKGRWMDKDVAIKVMNIDDKLDSGEKRKVFSEWRREVETMRSLFHSNIVAMRGVCLDPICMLLDLCIAGDLYHFLRDCKDPPNWKLRLCIAADVAKGMRFLHSVTPPIIHRDLKSPNVLLSKARNGTLVAKVADFGLSVRFGLVTEIKGTKVENPVWTAPEVLRGEPYNENCDVYSFAVILWELLTAKPFFGEIRFNSEIEKMVLRGERPKIPVDCPRLYEGLITKCWNDEVAQRVSFAHIVVILGKISEVLGLEADPSSASLVGSDEDVLGSALTLGRGSGGNVPAPARTVKAGVEIRPSKGANRTVEQEVMVLSPHGQSESLAVAQARSRSKGGSKEVAFTYEYAETLSPGHEGPVECMIQFSSNGLNVLWSGDNEGFVQVFNLETRKMLQRFKAHDGGVLSMVLVGKDTVWTCCRDGSIRTWGWNKQFEVQSLKVVEKPSKKGEAVTCMLSEGGVVVCGSTSGQIIAYRGHKRKKQVLAQADCSISCIVVSHGLIWVGVGNNVLCTSSDEAGGTYMLRGHSGPVHQLIKVQKDVWSVSSDKTCMVWTCKGGVPTCIQVLEGHSSRVFTGATDDTQFVWTGSWDKSIIAWNFKTRNFVKQMEIHHDDAVSALLWVKRAHDNALVSGSWDGKIVMWLGQREASEAKLNPSVGVHWGEAQKTKPKDVDRFAKGLKFIGRSQSKTSLSGGTSSSVSPSDSPRGTKLMESPRRSAGLRRSGSFRDGEASPKKPSSRRGSVMNFGKSPQDE
jgi:serine/threonine protein kinase/WD40 repeat protein/GTPase SAR1 family protein